MSDENSKLHLRNRKSPLKVYVSAPERQAIHARAQAARLTLSDYLRTLGVGHTLKSAFDKEAMQQLAKLHADQGRLGGLLKLWLTQSPDTPVRPAIHSLLSELRQLQTQLLALLHRDF